jgi:hypothetical protein
MSERVAQLAVALVIVSVIVGAIAAIADNDYGVEGYLEDLKILVLALAAVLLAMELPSAVHRRVERDECQREENDGR